MIKRFKSAPLQGAGYYGSLLRDHHAEAHGKDQRSAVERVEDFVRKFPYLWAKCDWCGDQAVLDDEGEEEPRLRFESLLNWTSYAPSTGNGMFHFCTRKCRIEFLDRHGSATMVH